MSHESWHTIGRVPVYVRLVVDCSYISTGGAAGIRSLNIHNICTKWQSHHLQPKTPLTTKLLYQIDVCAALLHAVDEQVETPTTI